MAGQDLPDYLRLNLDLIIVGINPGLRSGAAGHHYAFPGNHFWSLLYESGLIPEPLTFQEDHRVLDYGIGLTNLAHRTSRSAGDLTRAELAAGAEDLGSRLLSLRPRIVCFNGMGIFTAFSGQKKATLGLQQERFHEIKLFVTPSSSGRTAAYQRDVKLRCYQELKALVDQT